MEILEKLAECVEIGKADETTSFLPALLGQKGASELTFEALQMGLTPGEILSNGLITGMNRIGEKFAAGQVYIPNLLISAKAMKAAMVHLAPYFERGDAQYKGTFVVGTVQGDMHDIGKNIVKMVLQGGGWNIIDLGTNTSSDKFLEAIEKNQAKMVGLSALLTTTMLNMAKITEDIKARYSDVKVFVGGAPLSKEYNDKIGADGYFSDPHGLARYLDTLITA
ncbi:MAG TPA: cobalamin-dependent protein [Ignavibacteriales bacterium]|nr:cobalamin-dependent protein [Ignavibacteriales bacterium]